MNFIKKVLLKIKYQYKATSESYYKYLKGKGITLGKNVKFYSPWTINIDIQRPWMIEIGKDVHITRGVSILQHGYDWCVLQKKYGTVLGSCGKVKIGNNVFIGVNTTILKGTEIGDNVIIGANSLVSKKLESNAVYAGNPVRYICSIEDYYKKRTNHQKEEAVDLVKQYKKTNGKYPPKEALREFFWLFQNRNEELPEIYKNVLELENNYENSYKLFMSTKPMFNGYNEFIKYIEEKEND